MRNGDENNPKCLRVVDICLRLSTIPLSVASIWVMATNKQFNADYGMLQFSNLSGLKYLVSINAICAAYALLALVFNAWLGYFISDTILFVSDQVLAYLMVTSGAAVAEILYLGYKGDRKVSWSEACSSYGRFCSKAKVSLILHAVVFICFLILAVISAYRLFTKFEAPCISKEGNEEEE
ncbi:CASP-like protein 2D1 [Magnolia sinica]|uniref:CASP-like protein 2D1 n=1 Tax=Magnolia sinica TaxID=86752 RepID=UPI00265B322E|nr:CASP-like protein 2D1 [Magnolia sinica]